MEKNLENLQLDGGTLCFNFINTLHSRKEKKIHDYLTDYQEFIHWCRKVQVIDEGRLNELEEYARSNKSESVKALVKIKEIRENLYLLFSAIASGQLKSLNHKILRFINNSLSDALSNIKFELKEHHLEQTWIQNPINLFEPLWVILKSFFDLITTEDYTRMKECGACGWIFLDQTKNNKKRWCSPTTCGSIEKSKRYYYKKKEEKS